MALGDSSGTIEINVQQKHRDELDRQPKRWP
jgi:hypothetical protein